MGIAYVVVGRPPLQGLFLGLIYDAFLGFWTTVW